MREVTIKKVLNGVELVVGCQTLVFNDKSVMIAELSRYIDNPNQVEKEYLIKFAELEARVLQGGSEAGEEAYPLQGDGIRLSESQYRAAINQKQACESVSIGSPAGSVGGRY